MTLDELLLVLEERIKYYEGKTHHNSSGWYAETYTHEEVQAASTLRELRCIYNVAKGNAIVATNDFMGSLKRAAERLPKDHSELLK